jgi:hypothetical protein
MELPGSHLASMVMYSSPQVFRAWSNLLQANSRCEVALHGRVQARPDAISVYERRLAEFVQCIRRDLETAGDFTLSKVQKATFAADTKIGLPPRG